MDKLLVFTFSVLLVALAVCRLFFFVKCAVHGNIL
jgi:hypothetical protein